MSKYVVGAVSFTDIAKLPSGAEYVVMVNPDLPNARAKASAQIKAATSRAGKLCTLWSQDVILKMDGGIWRETHLLHIRIL